MRSLFMIRAGDEINNLDLFVVTSSRDEAEDHWRDFYGAEDSADIVEVRQFPFELPASVPWGPIEWDSMPTL